MEQAKKVGEDQKIATEELEKDAKNITSKSHQFKFEGDKNSDYSFLNDYPKITNDTVKTCHSTTKSSNAPVRTSSLLQKASGGTVQISDEARRKSDSFMLNVSRDENAANQSSYAPVRTSSLLQKSSGFVVSSSESIFSTALDRVSLISEQEKMLQNCSHLSTDTCSHKLLSILQQKASRADILVKINSMNSLYVSISIQGLLSIDMNDNASTSAYIKGLIQMYAVSESDGRSTKITEWMQMQVRWIIWSFAAFERRNDGYYGSLLTRENLQQALMGRYLIYIGKFSRSNSQYISKSTKHFAKIGSMSALQRCSDIATLLSPLIVVYSKSDEVTDGWWWTKVILDDDLQLLKRQQKLNDGDKIIIFNAQIEVTDSGTTMKLRFNSVKKVKSGSNLGYCKPEFLLAKSIAIKSLLGTGGPVHSVSVRVIHICPVMTMLKPLNPVEILSHTKAVTPTTNTLTSTKLIFNSVEIQELKNIFEYHYNKACDKLDGHEDLTLESLLDDIVCDGWTKTVILNCDKGMDIGSIDEQQQVQLSKAQYKIKQLYNDTFKRLVDDLTSTYNIDDNISCHVDILVECIHSKCTAWLRIPSDTDNNVVTSTLSLGKSFSVTNVNILTSKCKSLILNVSKNSSITHDTAVDTPIIPLTSDSDVLLAPTSFRYMLNRKIDINSKEVSFHGVIIDFRIDPNDGNVQLLLVDKDRILISFNYYSKQELTVPSAALRTNKSIDWLIIGKEISVSLALVQDINANYDIVRASRYDRTTVTANNKPEVHHCKNYYENEKRRYYALLESKLVYEHIGSANYGQQTENCIRNHFYKSKVSAQAISNGNIKLSVQDECNDSYYITCSENDIPIAVLTIIKTNNDDLRYDGVFAQRFDDSNESINVSYRLIYIEEHQNL